mmetsp:Transcript_26335/g.44988  ORF Transcript_26335/g.44988 Transcript_26335/m.44988 type:complete len:105 (+) Transcript_26335:46-360(+)
MPRARGQDSRGAARREPNGLLSRSRRRIRSPRARCHCGAARALSSPLRSPLPSAAPHCRRARRASDAAAPRHSVRASALKRPQGSTPPAFRTAASGRTTCSCPS